MYVLWKEGPIGGIFTPAPKEDCVFDLFLGMGYHSHLGACRGGMAVYGEDGLDRSAHNIENSPFRTKFADDVKQIHNNLGIGCISDYEAQPLIMRSHHDTYTITTVGRINNLNVLSDELLKNNGSSFLEMSGGIINPTELVTSLINRKDSLIDDLRYVQEVIDDSMSIMLLTPQSIHLFRGKLGKTPIVIGRKGEGFCASFESFAYLNLGYEDFRELGPGEIAVTTPEGVTTLSAPGKKTRTCTFLWVYYGYPSSSYEGMSVKAMRVRCGQEFAKRNHMTRDQIDLVAGIPDSGAAHAIGYTSESGVPFARPFIKYMPTWPHSSMPTIQDERDLTTEMKLIPMHELIEGQHLLLIDDSIVRDTQLRETTESLCRSGTKEVHVRPVCPPLLFGCEYLNFSCSTGGMELITQRMIRGAEGKNVSREVLSDYANPDSECYQAMLDVICKQLDFTTLRYNRLDDLTKAVGIGRDKLCTYCRNDRE